MPLSYHNVEVPAWCTIRVASYAAIIMGNLRQRIALTNIVLSNGLD